MTNDIPSRVPSKVRVYGLVHGDGPFRATQVAPGEYPCSCNRFGAVSVMATNGKMLGLKPHEFESLAWIENAIQSPTDSH